MFNQVSLDLACGHIRDLFENPSVLLFFFFSSFFMFLSLSTVFKKCIDCKLTS